MKFKEELIKELKSNSNREVAIPMENYMKNNFCFLGIKAEKRRTIFKSIYEKHRPEIKENYREITWTLFQENERELHYCAMDLIGKEIKNKFQFEDIIVIEKLIVTNSWWDSVDYIAKYLVGGYLNHFPKETFNVIEKFSNSENMWLNRTAIIFQLGYKEKTNFDLLKSECEKHKESKEFFIQKAIGWALREYSKTNPKDVKEYVNATKLKPLSKKEALRLIKN